MGSRASSVVTQIHLIVSKYQSKMAEKKLKPLHFKPRSLSS